MMQVELCAFAANTPTCDIGGHRFHFDAFSTVFDHPHEYDMYMCVSVYAFLFWSTFKSIFKLMHFQWKHSAY